jgi:hypothetical protein
LGTDFWSRAPLIVGPDPPVIEMATAGTLSLLVRLRMPQRVEQVQAIEESLDLESVRR